MSRTFTAKHPGTAEFSPCERYRYTLSRTWDASKGTVVFVGLNPSTATHLIDDPTILRCINFAKSWGYGRYVMLNMYGFRSTDPRGLATVADSNGPDNDRWISTEVAKAAKVVVAWGSHKSTHARALHVLSMIPEPYCLGTTKGGSPRHPLYVVGSTEPVPFSWLTY